MLECIWYAFAAAFIFIGMTATVFMIIIHILKTNAGGEYIIAIPVFEGDDDIGSVLYSAHMRLALLGDICRGRVIAVDMGMSEAQKNVCLGIMKECGNMHLCMPQELESFFRKES